MRSFKRHTARVPTWTTRRNEGLGLGEKALFWCFSFLIQLFCKAAFINTCWWFRSRFQRMSSLGGGSQGPQCRLFNRWPYISSVDWVRHITMSRGPALEAFAQNSGRWSARLDFLAHLQCLVAWFLWGANPKPWYYWSFAHRHFWNVNIDASKLIFSFITYLGIPIWFLFFIECPWVFD